MGNNVACTINEYNGDDDGDSSNSSSTTTITNNNNKSGKYSLGLSTPKQLYEQLCF